MVSTQRFIVSFMKGLLMAVVIVSLSVGYVSAEKITLTHLCWFGYEMGMDVVGRWKTEFEKTHPNIKIEFDNTPWADAQQKVIVQFLGGKAPDVVGMSPNHQMPWLNVGALQPLNEFIEKEGGEKFLEKFTPSSVIRVKGKVYHIPLEGGPNALFYNKKIFKEKGIGPPNTYQSFIEVAKEVTEPEKGIYAYTQVLHSDDYYGFSQVFCAKVLSDGGKITDEEGKAVFNTEVGIKALEYVFDLVKKYKVCPPGALTFKRSMTRERFMGGQDAINFGGTSLIPIIEKKTPDLDYGVVRALKGKVRRASYGGAHGLGVISSSKYKQAAWEYVKHVTSFETAKWFGSLGPMPVVREALKLPVFQKEPYKAFSEAMVRDYSMSPWLMPNFREQSRRFIIEEQKAFLGRISIKEALDKAVKEWNEIVEESKK